MVGSPIMSAYRSRDHRPHLTWDNLKNELLRLYSTIAFDIHATQAFAHLQQGPDELLKMYLHCAFVKDSSYDGHVSNSRWKTKPLHHSIWTKFTLIKGWSRGTPGYILKDHGRLFQWHLYCWCQIWKSQGLLMSWFPCPRNTNKWGKIQSRTRATL